MNMNDVGVLVTGSGPTTIQNLTVNGKSVRVSAWDLAENQDLFEQKTKIKDTSMPERVVLLRLREENVKCSQIKRIWRDELTFDDRNTPMLKITLSPAVPWVTGIASAATIVAQVFFSFPVLFDLNPAERGFAAGIWLSLVCVTGWILWQHFFPYIYAKRMRRFIDKINPELPDLLKRWDDTRWYRQASNDSNKPN